MALEPGLRLGPYEIVEPVGSGGMGEVYKALDTRLDRLVALKILPPELTKNERRRARFEREARAISSLNHPNVCTLYDVGNARIEAEVSGETKMVRDSPSTLTPRPSTVHYIVMELCDGQTLARHLDNGPLPLDRVFEYGIQIAEGLAKAHHAGVIHRDLKPSNIAVTSEGIKLLDFGLAYQGATGETSDSSTTALREDLTEDGQLLGTVRYMAPEVLNGAKADERSDLFSFGVVLHEMLTGQPPFSGDTRAELTASILKDVPEPVRKRQPEAPRSLELLVARCLVKEPGKRWESAHDLAAHLREIREVTSHPESSGADPPPSRRWATLLVVIAMVAVIGLTVWLMNRSESPEPIVRMTITAPELADEVAASPGGNMVAYSAESPDQPYRILVRPLERFEATVLDSGHAPFFSPDGKWVGYRDGDTMKKTPVEGGAPEVLWTGRRFSRGATWSSDGYIYFAPSNSFTGIHRIPEKGGKVEVITVPDLEAGENNHRWPHALPDGRSILFTIRPLQVESFDDGRIAVLTLPERKWRVIHEGGHSARYTSGFVVFARGNDLWAAPVDRKTWSLTAKPRKVVEGVASDVWGGARFDLTSKGDLVYIRSSGPLNHSSFFLVDREGNQEPMGEVNLTVDKVSLSPDRKVFAFQAVGANDQIWTFDLKRKVGTRLTFERSDALYPIWSADGHSVYYMSVSENAVMEIEVDGSSPPQVLFRKGLRPLSSSPDGRMLLYAERLGTSNLDLGLLSLREEKIRSPLTQTTFSEMEGRFSPDGKWISYSTFEGSRWEVFIQSLEPTGGRWQASQGMSEPAFPVTARWSEDGKELFYRRGASVYAVRIVDTGEGLQISEPEYLLDLEGRALTWEVIGDRFLTIHTSIFDGSEAIEVVQNWRGELDRTFNDQ